MPILSTPPPNQIIGGDASLRPPPPPPTGLAPVVWSIYKFSCIFEICIWLFMTEFAHFNRKAYPGFVLVWLWFCGSIPGLFSPDSQHILIVEIGSWSVISLDSRYGEAVNWCKRCCASFESWFPEPVQSSIHRHIDSTNEICVNSSTSTLQGPHCSLSVL